MKLVGQRVKRVEDPMLLAGTGMYLDDISSPQTAHAEFVRSLYPHARIVKIDFSAIEGSEGLLGCYTAKDFADSVNPFYIPKEHQAPIPKIMPLASDKVRWVGEPVAMIVASERYLAEDLATLVNVEYEPLETNVDPEKALEPGTPKVYDDWENNLLKHAEIKGGNVDQSFADAEVTIKEKIKTHRHTAAPIENRGVIAQYDPISKKLDVWSQVQFPHVGRTLFSQILKMPEEKIRFRMP